MDPTDGRTLISFDIDGTLEMGDPPGPLSVDFVRRTQERGHLIGSCSDRTIREQSAMWQAADILPDFVVVKNQLDSLRERFVFERSIHIGDTHVDAHFAKLAGFEFIFVLDLADQLGSVSESFEDWG
jgi:phosphoglycolate phosphatase-like HAD superfamily hydrolase